MWGSLGRGRRRSRGASAVEYIIVTALVGMAGIIGWRSFGHKARCAMSTAVGRLGGSGSGDCGGDGAGGGGAGGGGAGGGGAGAGASGPMVADNGGTSTPGGPTGSGVCVGGVCPPGSPNCFVAGTLVLTESGLQPIETLGAGTLVWARDEEGTSAAWKPVVQLYSRVTHELSALTIGDPDSPEVLEVTPNHRVHAKGRGWVEVAALVPGQDVLLDAEGRDLPVLAQASIPAEVPVYNLGIADYHTYFVGAHEAWVHNVYNNPMGHNVNPSGDPLNCLNCAISAANYVTTGQQTYANTNPYGATPNSPYTVNQDHDVQQFTNHGQQITFHSDPNDTSKVFHDMNGAMPPGKEFVGIVEANNGPGTNGHAFNVMSDGKGNIMLWDPQTHTGFTKDQYYENGAWKQFGPGTHAPAWGMWKDYKITDATNPSTKPPPHRVSNDPAQGYVPGKTYYFEPGDYWNTNGSIFRITTPGNYTVSP